jgi:hypothetical protein
MEKTGAVPHVGWLSKFLEVRTAPCRNLQGRHMPVAANQVMALVLRLAYMPELAPSQ